MIIFLEIILLIIIVKKMYEMYNKSEKFAEKIIFWIILFIIVIPYIIIVIDKNNIISKIYFFKNLDSDRWFSFIETYTSSIVGAIIGAVSLIIMTTHQLNLEREKNLSDRRLQNAPILKYSVDNLDRIADYEEICYNTTNERIYNVYIDIENIGLNHAKNLKIEISDNTTLNPTSLTLGEQSFLKKNEKKTIKLLIMYDYDTDNDEKNNKKIFIKISYQDLLNNKYQQNIKMDVNVTKLYNVKNGGNVLDINYLEISDEEYQK